MAVVGFRTTSSPNSSRRRVAALLAAGAMLLSLPGCGTQLTKEDLLAANRAGADAQPADQSTIIDSDVPTATTPGAVAPGGAAAPAAPAATGTVSSGAIAPATTTGKRPSSNANTTSTAGKSTVTKTEAPQAGTAASAICSTPKSEITIGTVGGQSGLIGSAVRAGTDAIKAWVAAINVRGGLACHSVKYYVADDGGDPSKNAALTQQMVEDRHVIAMVFSNNPLSAQGGKPILERAHVPTIGSEGGDDYFNTDPNFFPVAATGTKLIEANYGMLAENLTSNQKAHLGVLTCIEAAICANFGGPNGSKVANKFGLKVVYSSGSTMVQPDYTSNCESAKNAGAQVMFIVADGGMTSRTIRSCNKIGFHPQFATSPVAMAASVVDLPELEGILLGATAEPWVANDANAKRYLATLQKYVPGAEPQGSGSVGWAVAMMLEKVGANLPDNPTPQDIYEGLWKVKNFDFDGYTAPLTFAKGEPASYPTCWWTMSIHNKQWTTPDNGKRSCAK
jgi:branched-chain amino acid transport system substrate-binding protein